MNNQEEYIQQLEQVVSKFLEPLRGIPPSFMIKVFTEQLKEDMNKEVRDNGFENRSNS